MVQKISRRHLAQLLLLGVAGAGVSQILRKRSPIGRDVSSNETAQAVLQDKTSPRHEVARPTLRSSCLQIIDVQPADFLTRQWRPRFGTINMFG